MSYPGWPGIAGKIAKALRLDVWHVRLTASLTRGDVWWRCFGLRRVAFYMKSGRDLAICRTRATRPWLRLRLPA